MVRIAQNSIHSYLVNILDAIDKFCNAEGIRYSMAYGTLIGAVRHKGFIPWDDDIDIVMPRPDFERFISSFGKNPDDRYKCIYQCKDESAFFKHIFAKVHDTKTIIKQDVFRYGLYVDIFPVDGKPDDVETQQWMERTLTRYAHRLTLCSTHINPFNLHRPLAASIEAHLKGSDYYIAECNKIISQYPYEKCDKAGAVSMTRNGIREVFDKSLFESYTTLPFEGREFKAFKDYELFLTQQYGDYMALPPVAQRKSHNITAYLLP